MTELLREGEQNVSNLLSRHLWRIRYFEAADCAEVSGFDQFTAAMFCFCTPVALAFSGVLFGSWGSFYFAIGAILCSLPFSQGFRFKLTMSANEVVIRRNWIGIPYWWKKTSGLYGAKFEVMGTADWGEPGSWPTREFCEVSMPDVGRYLIGTPSAAAEMSDFLTGQKVRLMRLESRHEVPN